MGLNANTENVDVSVASLTLNLNDLAAVKEECEAIRAVVLDISQQFRELKRNVSLLAAHPLTTAEAAAYLGVSKSFLALGRSQGARDGRTPPPPYSKVGRAVRYTIADLDKWLSEQKPNLRMRTNRPAGNS